MKNFFVVFFILISSNHSSGQSIQLSDCLSITPLSETTFIHTCDNNNGMVYLNDGEALIVSTPDSDAETQRLIDWVKEEKRVKILGYVIDRWHPDAMEGLDVVHQNGIKSYAYRQTRNIALQKGLPVPEIGFDPKITICVGKEWAICHFLGEAHTKDGIVVWIPHEQILFGGNQIRNLNGWVGNIADANLDAWFETLARIKKEYGSAQIVLPGHGQHGGTELIDYSIALFRSEKRYDHAMHGEPFPEEMKDFHDDFHVIAEMDTFQQGKLKLINAKVYAQDDSKIAVVESPSIILQLDKKRLDSDSGQLTIYDKGTEDEQPRTLISYQKLIMYKEDDEVGLRIILKKFGQHPKPDESK